MAHTSYAPTESTPILPPDDLATEALKAPTESTPILPPDDLATEALNAPLTIERKIQADLENKLQKPYLARALVAPSVENPNGTPGRDSKGMSVLQQHVSFFDQDKDGVLYPWETFIGLRNLGLTLFESLLAATFLHIGLSYVTLSGWLPDPLFPIYIERIHKTKHGSTTGTFDTEGRFMPKNLENIFSKFARTVPNKLSFEELCRMTLANQNSYDFLGWVISKAEWTILYRIGADEDGYLSKEVARGCFDGSLFEHIAEMRRNCKEKNL